jgi:hypothetical protein
MFAGKIVDPSPLSTCNKDRKKFYNIGLRLKSAVDGNKKKLLRLRNVPYASFSFLFGAATLTITTFSIMTFAYPTTSITTFSLMTFGITAVRIITFRIATFSTMTVSTKHCNTEHKNSSA